MTNNNILEKRFFVLCLSANLTDNAGWWGCEPVFFGCALVLIRDLSVSRALEGVRSTACWYCTTEGLGSNLGTGSIFYERPLERFSNRILSCTKSTSPSYGNLSSKNLRNRTMPVNGNKL
jgi:hypothetical protein